MLRVGIIGAGAISVMHIKAYKSNPRFTLSAIADLNGELAEQRAAEFDIPKSYADYRRILDDPTIDAVSIVTPTFTHKDIVVESLRSGKHVLCEKPPALTPDEVRQCRDAARESGKTLMFAMVTRFKAKMRYLKEFIDSGKMGPISSAECGRVSRCFGQQGWFVRREMGGGFLIDSAIHELDGVLYLMGYPAPVSVSASQTFVNSDLYDRLKGAKPFYNSKDRGRYERNVESAITGFLTLDNGASIYVKAASILNAVDCGTYLSLSGERAGARISNPAGEGGERIKLLELTDGDEFCESEPQIEDNDPYYDEIDHFADCCEGRAQCICNADQAVRLMSIIRALYRSADLGRPVTAEEME